jgi:general secretion pathway protein G
MSLAHSASTTESNVNTKSQMTRDVVRVTLMSQRGLTLVEIMIVLTIMASIMGIAGVAVFGALDRAKIRETQTQAGIYAAGVEEYVVFLNELPDSLDQLVDPPSGAPKFVNEIKDDPWGNEYRYSSQSRSFSICSNGPDGSSGGDDDICAGAEE